MTIDNIALVRATNIVPFDGTMKPISESLYLKKDLNLEFSHGIREILIEEGIIPSFDFSKFGDEEYVNQYNEMVSKIMEDYLPYNSDYNSMILFSLNGLVPDDSEKSFGNNIFSNKKCVVIDSLSEHIDQVVSLVPTDTAVQGSMTLSKDAIILLEKNYYESLYEDQKRMLSESGIEIKLFEGNLKETVKETLAETGRFIPEELSLSRQDKGYRDSETKEMLLFEINSIAKERNIAQVLHFDVLTGQNDENEKLTSVENEFENAMLVVDYYSERFYAYLFESMTVPQELQNKVILHQHAAPYIKELCNQIKEFGLDRYKQIVQSYNTDLEKEQISGELLTPEEIVNKQKSRAL